MKNTTLTICLSAAIMAAVATEGFAAGDHRGGPRINFEEVDANADGLLSQSEMDAHREARFSATDTDGSGGLSKAEVEARMIANQDERRVKFLDRMFKKRDANGDGELTLAEMPNDRSSKMFQRADADGDGLISKAEFEAAKEAGRNKKNKAE